MSLITTACSTVTGLIQFADAVKQEVRVDGETFWWAPVGSDPGQLAELRRKGYFVFPRGGVEWIGWSKGSKRRKSA